MTTKHKRLFVAIVVPIQVLLAALAWRDIAARDDDQIKGRRSFWRIFVWLNPGNSLLYWLFARR